MIVADESAAAGLKPAFLIQSGVRMFVAKDLDRIVETARRQRPQLIIQQIEHPPEGSLRITNRLKQDPETSRIPLIAVAMEIDRSSVSSIAVDAVVNRPLILREYWDAVRRFVRLPRRRALRESVNLRFCYSDGERRCQAFSRDLSPYGAFLKTDQRVAVGERIEVSFTVPGDPEPIETAARVRGMQRGNQHTAGFGIEFEGMRQGDLERLEQFIAQSIRRTGSV